MKRKNENGLTEFEQRFSDLYLINPNATEAHIKAGFPGKSKLAHSVEGSKLLNNPNVQAYLDKRRQTIAEKVGLKQEDVLREVMSLAKTIASKPIQCLEASKALIDSGSIEEEIEAFSSMFSYEDQKRLMNEFLKK